MRLVRVQNVLVDIDEIAADAIVLRGGELRAVLEVGSVNFALQGEREQEATILGFAAFLGGLTFPVQILARVLPVDLAGYLDDLEQKARHLNGGLAELAHDHVAFLRRLARNQTLLERRFYLIVPTRAEVARGRGWWPFGRKRTSARSRATARHQLTHRCAEVERQLGRCGLSARRLADLELAQLLYAGGCPDLARTQRLRPRLADLTALVVQSRGKRR